MGNILKDKKGILGFELARNVLVGLLILAVVSVAVFAVLVPLDATTKTFFSASATQVNDTLISVDNVTGESVVNASLPEFSMTIAPLPVCINSSNGVLVNSTAATVAGVITSNATTCNDGFCGQNWDCTYTFSFTSDDSAAQISGNISSGITGFFDFTPTWMILLAVAILIAIIAIVIFAVTRLEGQGSKEFSP